MLWAPPWVWVGIGDIFFRDLSRLERMVMYSAKPGLASVCLVFVTALFFSLLLVPVTAKLARRIGAIDYPNDRSSHAVPTPRIAGLAISASLLISCLAFLPFDRIFLGYIWGLLVMTAIGFADDLGDLGPRAKFIGQIIGAGGFVLISGVYLHGVGDIFGLGNISLGMVGKLFTVFCIVGGINALNLSDGLDGLAGGISAIAGIFIAYFAWLTHSWAVLFLAVSLCGATIGFLRYNSYPARLFMGDSGSLILGYTLSVMMVRLGEHPREVPLVSLVMIVALPLLDTLLVMTRRIRHGQSPFSSDRTHLHHRLMALKLSHPAVVTAIYVLSLAFGYVAVVSYHVAEWKQLILMLASGGMVFGGVYLMQHRGLCFTGMVTRPLVPPEQVPWFDRITPVIERSAKLVSGLLLSLLLIPAFKVSPIHSTLNLGLLLFALSGLLSFFSLRFHHSHNSILHGATYLALFSLLLYYNLSSINKDSWLHTYVYVLSVVSLAWVVAKLTFKAHSEIVITSAFELLMLFVTWFIPFVVMRNMNFPAEVVEAVETACVLSIPFFLLAKIHIRLQEQDRWHWSIASLMGTLIILGIRSSI